MTLNIHNRRKELGLTLDDVAKFVGVTKSTVKKWESGDIKNMRRDKIMLLSKVLNLPPLAFIVAEEASLAYKDTHSLGNEIFFLKNSQVVFESFSAEDFEYLMKTIEIIKRGQS